MQARTHLPKTVPPAQMRAVGARSQEHRHARRQQAKKDAALIGGVGVGVGVGVGASARRGCRRRRQRRGAGGSHSERLAGAVRGETRLLAQ